MVMAITAVVLTVLFASLLLTLAYRLLREKTWRANFISIVLAVIAVITVFPGTIWSASLATWRTVTFSIEALDPQSDDSAILWVIRSDGNTEILYMGDSLFGSSPANRSDLYDSLVERDTTSINAAYQARVSGFSFASLGWEPVILQIKAVEAKPGLYTAEQ